MTPIFNLVEILPTTLPFGVDLVLRSTIILAIVQLAAYGVRRHSASTRHLIVTLGLAAVIALPILMLALPDARLEVLPADPSLTDNIVASDSTSPLGTWKSGDDTAATTASADVAEVTRAIAATGIANERAINAAKLVLWVGDNWTSFVLAGLTLIPAVLLGRMLIGMIAVWIVAHRAEKADEAWMQRELSRAAQRLRVARPIRMLLSDRINVPLVWGFVTPVLILPSSVRTWSRERFRVVVLHEVAHVRRFDVLSLMTGRLATALYWFHPLSWVLERTGRRECERACDDLVLQSGARPSDYADHLLGIATGEDLAESYASVTLAMARPSELEGRLVSILRAESERAPVSRRVATIAATTAFLMLLPVASVRLTARTVDEQPQADVQLAGFESESEPVGTIETQPSNEPSFEIQEDLNDQETVMLAQIEPTDLAFVMERATDVIQVKNRQKKKEYSSEGERWYEEAYEHHGNDRYDEAIEAFKKAIDNGYRVGASMYNIGCGYAIQGDVDNAIRWIGDAFANGFENMKTVEKDSDLDPIRSDPRFRGLLRDLRARYGVTVDKDRYDEARASFEMLRSTNSENAGKWADVGLNLLRLRELDNAIYALERAVRLEPEYSSAVQYNLACAFALRGDSSRALESLENAILMGFDGGDKMVNDPDLESIRDERRFSELRVLNDDLSLWGGIKKEKKHESGMKWDKDAMLRKELPRFEAVVNKYPDAGRAWFNLGFAALRAGDFDRSRAAFERSLGLGFKRATSMYNLACVEALAGNREAAFQWLYKSEEAGGSLGNIHHDEDFDSLRGDPRFDQLLERVMQRTYEEKRRKHEKQAQEAKAKDAGRI